MLAFGPSETLGVLGVMASLAATLVVLSLSVSVFSDLVTSSDLVATSTLLDS